MIAVGENSLVVALDRGFDNSDGAVAWCVNVQSVENVGAARRPIDNREQGAASRHFRVVEGVEVAGQYDRRRRKRRRHSVNAGCIQLLYVQSQVLFSRFTFVYFNSPAASPSSWCIAGLAS